MLHPLHDMPLRTAGVSPGARAHMRAARTVSMASCVHAPEQLRDKGLEIARMIASKGPVAVRLTKQIVQRGQDLDLANACQQEAYAFGLTCATADQKEGMKAFLEKRPARFTGR